MLQCPQCTKPLRELVRRCPTCQADLDLLVDYVSHLQGGLERAENLVRAGELGQATWAYLEVLEVDPDNATARRQVGQVATAVRQFDFTTPGRRWASNLPPLPPRKPGWPMWLRWSLIATAVVLAFVLGMLVRDIDWTALTPPDNQEQTPPKQDDTRLGFSGRQDDADTQSGWHALSLRRAWAGPRPSQTQGVPPKVNRPLNGQTLTSS